MSEEEATCELLKCGHCNHIFVATKFKKAKNSYNIGESVADCPNCSYEILCWPNRYELPSMRADRLRYEEGQIEIESLREKWTRVEEVLKGERMGIARDMFMAKGDHLTKYKTQRGELLRIARLLDINLEGESDG